MHIEDKSKDISMKAQQLSIIITLIIKRGDISQSSLIIEAFIAELTTISRLLGWDIILEWCKWVVSSLRGGHKWICLLAAVF